MEKIYVRLKPVHKAAGFHCRRFVWRGVLFKTGEWKLVPPSVAEELASKIQPRSEQAPRPLFDVGNREEVERLMKEAEPAPMTKVDGAQDVSSEFRPTDAEKAAAQEAAPRQRTRRPRK